MSDKMTNHFKSVEFQSVKGSINNNVKIAKVIKMKVAKAQPLLGDSRSVSSG